MFQSDSLLVVSLALRLCIQEYHRIGFYFDFSNDICSESSDKICWIIEEEGKDLPISEELRNTVKKLRSLVEAELGKNTFQ